MVWLYIARSTFSVSAVRIWKMFESGIDRAAAYARPIFCESGLLSLMTTATFSADCARACSGHISRTVTTVKTAARPRDNSDYSLGHPSLSASYRPPDARTGPTRRTPATFPRNLLAMARRWSDDTVGGWHGAEGGKDAARQTKA